MGRLRIIAAGAFLAISCSSDYSTIDSPSDDTKTVATAYDFGRDSGHGTSGDQLPVGLLRIGGSPIYPIGPGWPPGVAIVDTGIDASNPDLNVVGGINCGPGDAEDWTDTDGHGTSLAGVVGAKRNGEGVIGLAPGTELYSVRVFANETQASEENVLCGLRWVQDNTDKIDVALLAFNRADDLSPDDSTCESDELRSAICALTDAGVTVVVAAGNQKLDAAGFVPAKLEEVITVGAFVDFDGLPGGQGSPTCGPGVDDSIADFSNTGDVVDLLAPGVCIRTTRLASSATAVDPSGTSLAAAHVSGAVARYLSCYPDARPNEVREALLTAAETVNINDLEYSLVAVDSFHC